MQISEKATPVSALRKYTNVKDQIHNTSE